MEDKELKQEWKKVKSVKIPNAPEYLSEVVGLIIEKNPNLKSDFNLDKEKFDSDITEENLKRLEESYKKLVEGIRAFEEAMLYF